MASAPASPRQPPRKTNFLDPMPSALEAGGGEVGAFERALLRVRREAVGGAVDGYSRLEALRLRVGAKALL